MGCDAFLRDKSFQEAGMNCTRARSGWLWLLFLVLTLTVFALTPDAEARVRRVRVAAPVGTETCVGCHIGWQDNNPPLNDVAINNADIDYFPLNFAPRSNSFYFIPEAYSASIHGTPRSNPTATDHVTCEASPRKRCCPFRLRTHSESDSSDARHVSPVIPRGDR